MDGLSEVVASFKEMYGGEAAVWAVAPGRVEVLGNHTDYNDGFILAAAIDRRIVIAGRARPGPECRVHSLSYGEDAAFRLDQPLQRREKPFWINYIAGVVDQLRKTGESIDGFDAVVWGDVPLGAGLSSSAALEVATAGFLRQLQGFELPALDLARLCQRAENQFVGVNSGLLDQYSSAMGRAGRLVYMDCRAPENGDTFPLGDQAALVIADSRVKHALIDGGYNRLRESCFAAARYFAQCLPERRVTHLRDVSVSDWERFKDGLDPEDRRRARHIITENERVLRGVEALKRGDLATMGQCMFASHASSRDDFGNSCAELDLLVELARGLDGCHGARLSGGGFGGCTVNLVEAAKAEEFAETLTRQYNEKTGNQGAAYLCHAADGMTAGAF